jgi:hypothetical protein
LELERLLELLLSNQAFFEQNFAEPDGHPRAPNTEQQPSPTLAKAGSTG